MTQADDEDISIWGHQHKAAVVTHDKAMIRLRQNNTYGLHVYLECADTDAVEIMAKQLPAIVASLDGKDAVVLEVTRNGVRYWAGQWH